MNHRVVGNKGTLKMSPFCVVDPGTEVVKVIIQT